MIQARRPQVMGPKRVVCAVRDRATGREVTKAFGHITHKWSAQARSRENALWKLRRKLKRRFDLSEYKLFYRQAKGEIRCSKGLIQI